MKKLFCFGLLFALFATGCDNDDTIVDSGATGYFQWINGSDHTISMTLDGWREMPALSPGADCSVIVPILGSTSFSIVEVMRDGCRIVFDDGPYGGEFVYDPLCREALNPCVQDNYTFQRKSNTYTYTFTNADYEAAVARGPMEEGEDDAHWGFE